jgi:hypothetical protein
MPKTLLQLTDDAIVLLRENPETGMGFYIVKGHFPQTYVDRDFVIGGNYYLLPFRHPEIFSVADLLEGTPMPHSAERTSDFAVSRSAATRHDLALPPGYMPKVGCFPLYNTVTLTEDTVCARYLGSGADNRVHDGILAKDTLVTTRYDLNEVRTGYGAVARYALPLPSPASHVFEYELPAGTQLLIGTIPPCFAQIGGGIEMRLSEPTPVVLHGYRHLSDF